MGFKFLLATSFMLTAFSAHAGEYVVKFSNQKAADKMFYSLQDMNAEMTEVLHSARLGRVLVEEDVDGASLAQLRQMDGVEYVVRNFQFKAFKTNVTPLANLREQYANSITSVEQAWAKAGNKGSRAVIDTGADYTHESLKDNMLPGYDFAKDDDDPQDETSFQNPGHGTHCSGSVGSTGTVDGGTQGASPVVSLIPIRFLDERGSGDLLNSVKAIDFAIENGAHIISASWGAEVSAEQAEPITEAIRRAQAAGIAFVAAAGNSSKDNDTAGFFPTNADVSNVISVAASDQNDRKASFSNFGEHSVDIAAPGVDIISTTPQNRYQNLSGTSMAAPFVSGALAFLKAQDMTLTPEELEALVQATGDKVDIENACNCRINVLSAYNAVVEKTAFFVPTTKTVAPNGTQAFRVKNMDVTSYATSDANVATIDANGTLTAVSKGTVTLTATDAEGNTVNSLTIRIADKSDGGSGGGGGGGGGSCPFDPATCAVICPIAPQLCGG